MADHLKDLEHKLKEQHGLIYCCGNGHTMVKDVELLINEFMKNDSYLKDLAKENRYKKEVWVQATPSINISEDHTE